MDGIATGSAWIDRGFAWAGEAKSFNATWPARCALGLLYMDHFANGYDSAKRILADYSILKIVFERGNVTAMQESFLKSQRVRILTERPLNVFLMFTDVLLNVHRMFTECSLQYVVCHSSIR
jgi:hypothetical protein